MTFAALIFSAAALAIGAPFVGPTAKEFAALRAANGEKCPQMRNLKCYGTGEWDDWHCEWDELWGGSWLTVVKLIGGPERIMYGDQRGRWEWFGDGPRCSKPERPLRSVPAAK